MTNFTHDMFQYKHLSLLALGLLLLPAKGEVVAPGESPDQTNMLSGENRLELSSRLAPPDLRATFQIHSQPVSAQETATRVSATPKGTRPAANKLELTSDGASGSFGAYSVGVFGDVFGGVWLITPGGERLQSRVVGLGYFSEGGRSQMLCGLKSSAGELHGETVAVYPDAFDSKIEADIIYECNRSRFEQSVILRRRLPTPQDCGFGPDERVTLGVVTEFFATPEPKRRFGTIDLAAHYERLGIHRQQSIPDETLGFNGLRMVEGTSFVLGNQELTIPSGKIWKRVYGENSVRQFLIESTPYDLLEPMLKELPPLTASFQNGKTESLDEVLRHDVPALGRSGSKLIAKTGASLSSTPGVVLDYIMVTTPLLNVDFGLGSKSGPAAFGFDAFDYWNTWYFSGTEPGSLTDLDWSDATASTVGLVVSNAPGYGSHPLCLDPMYYSSSLATNGSSLAVLITNLPADEYDVVVYAARASAAGAPRFELRRSGITLWHKHTTYWGADWFSSAWEEGEQYVRFRNIGVTNQQLLLISKPDSSGVATISGLQIIPSDSFPDETPDLTQLLNIDFAAYSSNKVGFAATGISTQDFWNGHPGVANSRFSSQTNLQWYDQNNSTIGVVMRNAPGGWANSITDTMMRNYNYSHDGGNLIITITNLPAGIADLYVYGHGLYTNDNTIYEVWSDEVPFGIKGTSTTGYGPLSNRWEVGQQYVKFQGLTVASNAPLIIQAKHGNFGYDYISGLQLAYTGEIDSDADGLPDGWELKWFGTLDATADGDPDSDTLTNLREYNFGLDTGRADSDGDSVPDWQDSEFPLLEDAAPQGGFLSTSGGDTWNWVSTWYDGDGWGGALVYPHSGEKFRVTTNSGTLHQHSFDRSVAVSRPRVGEMLYAWVNLDSTYPPQEIMLQFYTLENNGSASWDHRAYWGANLISYGVNGTASRYPAGDLPETGQWVRLEIPAAALGLEGKIIEGMAFTLYDGRAAWDGAGILAPDMDGDGWLDSLEIAYFSNLTKSPLDDHDNDGLPNGVDANPVAYDTSAIEFAITSPLEGAQF